MKGKIKDTLNIIKDKFNMKKVASYLSLLIIFIIFGIAIKILKVDVLSNEEIKSILKDNKIMVDNNEVELKGSDLIDLNIISRRTKKDTSDKVDVNLKINSEGNEKRLKGTINFNYEDDKWKYTDSDFESIVEENKKKNILKLIENYILEKGFSTVDNKDFYPELIKKVDNINIDFNQADEKKRFSADMILFNGAFFQDCKLTGEVLGNSDDDIELNNIEVSSDKKIYKENSLDESIIKSIVFSEILNKGYFTLENNGGLYEEFIELKEDDIKDMNIKSYIIREDSSIRAEVEGTVYLEEYEDEFKFDGIVVISNELCNGNMNNAKKINIYDVPFNINSPSIENEDTN